MPRQSINTHASLWRAKRRRGRRSSPAIWLGTFPAAPLTFDTFSISKATRLRHWILFLEQWDGCFNAESQKRNEGRFLKILRTRPRNSALSGTTENNPYAELLGITPATRHRLTGSNQKVRATKNRCRLYRRTLG